MAAQNEEEIVLLANETSDDQDATGASRAQRREMWCCAIDRTIKEKADGDGSEQNRPLLYYQKLDAIANDKYPSIFRLQPPNKVVTAAIGPHHRPGSDSAPAERPMIVTDGKKRGIVTYLARRHRLDTCRFLRWVLNNEKRIRGCYDDCGKDSPGNGKRVRVPLSPEELAEMLLLDGCLVLFAIFHLRSSKRKDRRPAHLAKADLHRKEFINVSADITFYMKQLRLDLLMLDNQIPFFVVENLYHQVQTTLFHGVDPRIGIKEMALSCFDDILPGRSDDSASASRAKPTTVHHLLHLFHWSRVPSCKYEVKIASLLHSEPKAHLPSATELRESATLFWRSSSGSPLDVKFQRSIGRLGLMAGISIPAVHICDYSESIFRNLIAFEQRHIRCSLSVTAYAICMARLLESEADAKILRKEKILAHTQKTDQEIVAFFRSLSSEYKDTCLPKDLKRLYKDVARHHNSCLARNCCGVMFPYCSNWWITISVLAAVIIFFGTLANNIHSTYRYYHPLRH